MTECVLVGLEEVVHFNEVDCHDRRQTFGMIEIVDFERCAGAPWMRYVQRTAGGSQSILQQPHNDGFWMLKCDGIAVC